LRWMILLPALVGFAAAAPKPALSITHAAVRRFEDGPPVYKPDEFTAGETVYFSLLVEGFSKKDDKVDVRFEAQPKDPDSVALTPPVTNENSSTLSPEDKDWVPKLRGSFPLPVILKPGTYHILIHVTDEIAGVAADHELEFRVGGEPLETSAVLAIRQLHFYRNDEDQKPLDVAAYRLSEEIHARFAILGFRHGDQGAIDVSYGISLADVNGHVLFQQPVAARDDTAEFYPKPYVPGVLAFSLKQGTPAGEYVLTVTARDAVGDQKAEATGKFRLE
jgi:hypothetical protein